jgi:NAD(P)H dehydrogenase (quinone)
VRNALSERLDNLSNTAPIPFRAQNGGDYRIRELTFKDDIAPGRVGFGVHVK